MNNKEVMQAALDALERFISFDCNGNPYYGKDSIGFNATELLRTALAQPEHSFDIQFGISYEEANQQTLAWADKVDVEREGHDFWVSRQKPARDGVPLYTAPPQREWVGLTEEEKLVAYSMYECMGSIGFVQAIEAKLKEKNT